MMANQVDCLLVAYSGINRKSKEFEVLLKQNSDFRNIETSFNSAIAYLASCLHKKGLTFDFINSIEDDQELFIEKLKTNKVMSVGISTTLCDDINQVTQLINLIKEINPNIKVILGGPVIVNYVRVFSEQSKAVLNFSLKKVKADFIVDSFYGEDTLASILISIKNNLPMDKIPNIYYRENNGFEATEKIKDDYNLEENRINWGLFTDRVSNTISVRTSVSCHYSCSFCCFPVLAGKYKCLDINEIEKDLNDIERLGKIKLIQFIDDTFNVPINRFKEILHLLIKNNYSFKWHSFIRCQFLDEETVELMKESGCIGVFLGIESGNESVLKAMNKSTNIDAYRKGIALLNKHGIVSVAAFIIGFPEETLETITETVAFIEETKPTFYYMGPWVYDPRTPISKQSEKYELTGTHRQWSHKTMTFDTANKLTKETKSIIQNSVLVDHIPYPVLFQILNMGIDLEKVKDYFNKCKEELFL